MWYGLGKGEKGIKLQRMRRKKGDREQMESEGEIDYKGIEGGNERRKKKRKKGEREKEEEGYREGQIHRIR